MIISQTYYDCTNLHPGVQMRFAKSMADYCNGTLVQVQDSYESNLLRPEEMLARRQCSAGVSPLFALVEYANELDIPAHVFEHPIIQTFVQIGIDLVMMWVILMASGIAASLTNHAELTIYSRI